MDRTGDIIRQAAINPALRSLVLVTMKMAYPLFGASKLLCRCIDQETRNPPGRGERILASDPPRTASQRF